MLIKSEENYNFLKNTTLVMKYQDNLLKYQDSIGISNVGSGTPSCGVKILSMAVRRGASVEDMTDMMVHKALVDAAPKSLPRIASGLRCWHRFAVEVLNMQAEQTLPPQCDAHVILYTAVFRNGNTCKNYISSLRFGCRMANVNFAWDTDRLKHCAA